LLGIHPGSEAAQSAAQFGLWNLGGQVVSGGCLCVNGATFCSSGSPERKDVTRSFANKPILGRDEGVGGDCGQQNTNTEFLLVFRELFHQIAFAMSSAVQDFQKAIVDGKQSLTQLLRQTRVIAAKLNLEQVERWVDLELTGFAQDAEPPAYRKVLSNRLEIYNSHRNVWQFAGHLNYALKALQPIAEIEAFSRRESIDFPVAKNFSITNDVGDSFGSDWPQRFVVLGSEYKRVLEAVAERWTAELEMRGISIVDAGKFAEFLNAL
jgi:hypothetical protein